MASGFQPRYQVGLSLSGAVSAGAYSAGVLDFLLQALDAWEAAADGPDVPAPAVGIKVMSGASAGAITAAIGAISLQGDLDSCRFLAAGIEPGSQPYKYWSRRLYETWVVKPALVSDSGGTDLLSPSDLNGTEVLSVLNSRLLDEIAHDALSFTAAGGTPAPPRQYVSATLHIYITLANLRGTPYYVPFTGGIYGMMQHGDRAHYILHGLGDWQTTSDFADADVPSQTLDAAALYVADQPDWKAYGDAALASAAFPVGLAPRVIPTSTAHYKNRGWPIADWQALQGVQPQFADPWLKNHVDGHFTFTAVDGGVINNDPFEYALYTLPDKQETPRSAPIEEKTDPRHADRGVIMIAPFPEAPVFPPDGSPPAGLIGAYMALMPALKQQVRFKPEALALAGNDQVGSRFMISPSRPLTETLDARFPIASGLLGGFGGFVARSFRDHDFQLGRRNCQRFLQTSFLLPPTNPIVQASYARVGDGTRYEIRHPDQPDHIAGRPVVPLLDDAARVVQDMDWPRITQAQLDTILQRLQVRLASVASKLLSTWKGIPVLKLFAPLAGFILPRLARRTIRRSFLSDLVRRDLIAEWMLPPGWSNGTPNGDAARLYEEDTRAVIGALLSPSFDLRTVDGLMLACDLDVAGVARILAQCEAAEGQPYQVWQSDWTDSQGSQLVCLLSDRPGWLKRQFGKDHAGSLFFAPKIDPPVPKAGAGE